MTTTTPFLFVDSLATAHLSALTGVGIGEKNVVVKGFEAYLVEQWVCERRLNRVVCSYTGNSSNTVTADVLHLPPRENWGAALNEFMELMSQNHLLTKDTSLGRMFIANLSSFPSNKTLIAMNTIFSKSLASFTINENLKRLACTGRLVVSLSVPSDASKSNFYASYGVPTDVPLNFAIPELVTLFQISLFYCGMLDSKYVDGFLCDYTIRASQDWWKKFGETVGTVPNWTSQAYLAKTVAAVVGFILGCNYRFSLLGFKPPKDCFSVHQFLQCVKSFQKSERLDKTMRLNTSTVHRLRDLTAKQMATGPDLISSLKSTVKENLRGKIQAAVDDFETTDIDVLAAHVKGARAKYLWKATGHRFVPMAKDGFDPITGLPAASIADDGTEPKSLLRSPRQKGTSKLLRKHNYAAPRSIDPPENYFVPPPSRTELNSFAQAQTPDITQGGSKLGSPLIQDSQETTSEDEVSTSRKLSEKALLTRDDCSIPKQRIEIRRTQSTSTIDSLTLKWSFTASIARVYRDYLDALALREEFENHINSNKETYDQLRETLALRGADYTNENRYSDTIKYRITQSLRKEQIVKHQVSNLEAMTAKLDFQWNFLVHQVDEVEKSVNNFSDRVESSVARWNKLQQQRSKRSIWWLRLQAYWRTYRPGTRQQT